MKDRYDVWRPWWIMATLMNVFVLGLRVAFHDWVLAGLALLLAAICAILALRGVVFLRDAQGPGHPEE